MQKQKNPCGQANQPPSCQWSVLICTWSALWSLSICTHCSNKMVFKLTAWNKWVSDTADMHSITKHRIEPWGTDPHCSTISTYNTFFSMHNATLLIYDSAVYLGGDRAKVCSLWLHCCTGRAGISLCGMRVCQCRRCASQMDWHIYEGFPAGWDTETFPQLIRLSYTEPDIYPMHCSWTQCAARIPVQQVR